MEDLKAGLRAASIRSQLQTWSLDTCFTYLIHELFC